MSKGEEKMCSLQKTLENWLDRSHGRVLPGLLVEAAGLLGYHCSVKLGA